MADSRFRIVISAVDQATATLRKVNQSFSKLTRPIADMNSAAKAFSKEAGLDKIGKSMVSVGRSAGDAAAKIAEVATPLAVVTSYGSVAGMAALAVEWAHLGSEVGRTALTLGVSQNQLQSLRGAASLAGVSTESLTSGIKSLGNTMEDALYGRNQQALGLMNRLGVSMHHTKEGAVDTARAFYDIADAIARQKNPQVQQLIARTFGLEESLPLLRQGSKAVREFEEAWRRTGAVMSPEQTAQADKFRQSIVLLGGSLMGVANAIALDLSQVRPWIDWVSHAIQGHEHLAVRIGEVAAALLSLRAGFSIVSLILRPVVSLITAAVLPVLGLLASGFLEVGTAILVATGPIGWLIAGLSAIAALSYQIYQHWDALGPKLKSGIVSAVSGLGGSAAMSLFHPSGAASPPALAAGGSGAPGGGLLAPVVTGASAATPFSLGQSQAAPGAPAGTPQALVTVVFENAPRGMRTRTDTSPGLAADARINYAMPSYP